MVQEICMKKRNVNIELVRIIACISVIALHTWKGSGIDTVSKTIKGVIRVFEKHNNPLFFMIMGFFLFVGNKSYTDRIKDLVKKIIVPFIWLYCFMSFYKA